MTKLIDIIGIRDYCLAKIRELPYIKDSILKLYSEAVYQMKQGSLPEVEMEYIEEEIVRLK